jgi:hypothetical protein
MPAAAGLLAPAGTAAHRVFSGALSCAERASSA